MRKCYTVKLCYWLPLVNTRGRVVGQPISFRQLNLKISKCQLLVSFFFKNIEASSMTRKSVNTRYTLSDIMKLLHIMKLLRILSALIYIFNQCMIGLFLSLLPIAILSPIFPSKQTVRSYGHLTSSSRQLRTSHSHYLTKHSEVFFHHILKQNYLNRHVWRRIGQ